VQYSAVPPVYGPSLSATRAETPGYYRWLLRYRAVRCRVRITFFSPFAAWFCSTHYQQLVAGSVLVPLRG